MEKPRFTQGNQQGRVCILGAKEVRWVEALGKEFTAQQVGAAGGCCPGAR